MEILKGFTTYATLTLLRVVTPAVVALLTLYASTLVMSVKWTSGYGVLAAMAAALSLLLLAPLFRSPPLGVRGFERVGNVLLAWGGVVVILLFIGYATKTSSYFSRRALFVWIVGGGVLLTLAHWWLELLTAWLARRTNMLRTAVVAGVNDASIELSREIETHPQLGLKVKGFFDDRVGGRNGENFGGELVGKLADIPNYIRKNDVDVIFLSLPMRHVKRVRDLLDELHDTTVSIYFVPDVFVFDLIQSQVLSIGDTPVVALCETPFFGYRGLIKRMTDIVIGAMATVLLSPILILAALLIKLTSPGSVIFRQQRYGLDGQKITIFKFRTMRVSDDGDVVKQATVNDDRLTPIGGWLRKWSIDELPQLFNVLQGTMSLVGPRPHAVAHNEEYRKLIKGYMFRHKVLPGMTGWAQVNGFRGGTERLEDMQGRVEHDLYYLRNWSISFDLKIMALTILHVASAEKAY